MIKKNQKRKLNPSKNRSNAPSHPLKLKFAVFLLAFSALASSLESSWKELRLAVAASGEDRVTVIDFEEMYNIFKSLLPTDDVVGFITDRPDLPGGYLTAQYSLVPTILENKIDHLLVIGYFDVGALDNNRLRGNSHLIAIKEIGNGRLVLFKNDLVK